MIEIKPNINHQSNCPYCQASLEPFNVRWQGIHIYVESKCISCQAHLWEGLRVGHAEHKPFQIDPVKGSLLGLDSTKAWLSKSILQSLQNIEHQNIDISKEIFRECQKVILLNCIDSMYGHCLLKLLNAQRHLEHHSEYGLIVIVPKFLRWMVPEGVAEIWTVPISLRKGQCYYPSFSQFVEEELKRFEQVYVSKAYLHPSQFDITRFTGVPKHSFEQEEYKITFIWRENRLWCRSKMLNLGLLIQNWRVKKLFEKIRAQVPEAKFAITGLGMHTTFPDWIEDLRVDRFDEKIERQICKLYSESRLVIGIHGSHMLLPSAHAGMTLDLIPNKRWGHSWGNFAQDILYQETDPRLAAFRYRYLPAQTSINEIVDISLNMLLRDRNFCLNMTADKIS